MSPVVDESLQGVSDASKDERFAENPLVVGLPGVRFYAGFPVYTPDHLPVGTVYLIDRKPRDFDREQLNELGRFAKRVEEILEKRASQPPSSS